MMPNSMSFTRSSWLIYITLFNQRYAYSIAHPVNQQGGLFNGFTIDSAMAVLRLMHGAIWVWPFARYNSPLIVKVATVSQVTTLSATALAEIKASIRIVPDFPKSGIQFLDIASLLQCPVAYGMTIDAMVANIQQLPAVDKVIGIEARGFLPAASIATTMRLPMCLLRKPGKLPGDIISDSYSLEYGTSCLELQASSIQPGDKVVIVDDVLATGGTVMTACKLVERLGGEVVLVLGMIGLEFLPYRQALQDYHCQVVVGYQQDEL